MTLAERLIAARKHADLTQDGLAKAVGISQQAIQKLESGKAEGSRRLTQIAIACGVRPEWLASESGPMLAAILQVKEEVIQYEAAPQSQSQPLQLDLDKLHAATAFLEAEFGKRRRQFVPSQQIGLIVAVYEHLLRTPEANAVALTKRFAQELGDGNERERKAGGTEPADRGSNRKDTSKAKSAAGRPR